LWAVEASEGPARSCARFILSVNLFFFSSISIKNAKISEPTVYHEAIYGWREHAFSLLPDVTARCSRRGVCMAALLNLSDQGQALEMIKVLGPLVASFFGAVGFFVSVAETKASAAATKAAIESLSAKLDTYTLIASRVMGKLDRLEIEVDKKP
jgi:hypothetical protein